MNERVGSTVGEPGGTKSEKTMKQKLCVFNRNRESFLGLRVAPADTLLMRLKGLLGRIKLKPDDGIWLVPSRGIHTIGMLFAIDLIYLDAANRVIHLVEHMGPFRISPIRIKCASILELKSRAIYSSNTQIGDDLLIGTPDEIKAYYEQNRSQPVPGRHD
jgi:uncharacterized membrane protein (UPF0127 family)